MVKFIKGIARTILNEELLQGIGIFYLRVQAGKFSSQKVFVNYYMSEETKSEHFLKNQGAKNCKGEVGSRTKREIAEGEEFNLSLEKLSRIRQDIRGKQSSNLAL